MPFFFSSFLCVILYQFVYWCYQLSVISYQLSYLLVGNNLYSFYILLLIGGQQKHVTHPTLIDLLGPATKTRYRPYINWSIGAGNNLYPPYILLLGPATIFTHPTIPAGSFKKS